MREIKFRAWDIKGKTMYLFRLGDVLEAKIDLVLNCDEDVTAIMQYTGLKDKNGKEIYEGDILKSDNYKYPHKIIYTFGSFKGKLVRGKFKGYVDGLFFDRFEVIGNIYENPELLGRQK